MNHKKPSPAEQKHFSQEPRRKAEFIMPPNTLKSKVGSGGIGEDILEKARILLETNSVDFQPLAEMYLNKLMIATNAARAANRDTDIEAQITALLHPAMQLKSNGGMFHYPLVTTIADKLVQFLEVLAKPDEDALEIIMAFHTTIRAVVMGRITNDGGRHGKELVDALDAACMRYFTRYPYNSRTDDDRDSGDVF